MARATDGYTSFPRRGDNAISAATSTSLMDDLSVVSSAYDTEKKESPPQSGLIGSMLGRLTRKKSIENEYHEATPTIGRSHTDMYQTPKNESSVDEADTPYHRIVSAPPGKIGISFVEYRGHAMVSSVSDESPLVGWVFPSDVLVAIDDVPVSGLRTREIVKLLTNKIKQQRNLRMVSAVSMNEIG
jgi:C-terminal processing protease CtpA/Prc